MATFNLRQLAQNLAITLPPMADANALTKVAIDTKLAGSSKNLSLSGMKLVLDNSNISGDLSVSNFADPAIGFKLGIDAINADNYLPPRPEGTESKGATAATVAGPGGAAGPSDWGGCTCGRAWCSVRRLTSINSAACNGHNQIARREMRGLLPKRRHRHQQCHR